MVDDDTPQDRAGDKPDRHAPARASGEVTLILSRIEQGEPQAAEQLLPLVYAELRKLAAAKMAREDPGQTLQATALVHEAYIRLVDSEKARHWDSRGHFFAAAAEAMRRILVEQVRRKAGPEAGGHLGRLHLSEVAPAISRSGVDILILNETLDRLAAEDPRKAELVKLRFFGGMTIEQAAQLLGISVRTACEDWAYAKSWLRVEMAHN